MNNILKKYKLCSIGYDCCVKKYITQYKGDVKYTICVFDYIGTPMWAINELILNNFADFTNILYFEELKINSKYRIRFVHDNTDNINKFMQKYDRRITSFKEFLKINCIYLRNEEPNITPEHKQKYTKYNINELEHIKQFTSIVKNSYVLFFTKLNTTQFLEDFNIIIINYKNNITWENCINEYEILINDNINFINSCLKIV